MANIALIEAAKNAQALNEPISVTVKNRFTKSFDEFACEGDTITAHVDGLDIIAKIVRDDSADRPDQRDDGFWPTRDPESAGYVEAHQYEAELARAHEVMNAWKNDEWFYCGVVLSVEREGVELHPHTISLWGLECNYPKNPTAASAVEDYPNNYLTEVANEMLGVAVGSGKERLASLSKGRILITMEGGIIQGIENVPPGVTVEVRDFDVEGTGLLEEHYKRNELGQRYIESLYEGDAV